MNRLTDAGLRAEINKARTAQVARADGSVPGLSIRMGAGRTATWSLLLRVSGEGGTTARGNLRCGRKHRLTLGTYPALSLEAARAKANQILDDAKRGTNPVVAMREAATVGGLTVAQLSERFLRDYVDSKQLRSALKYKLAFVTHINPLIGDVIAELVSREQVREVMQEARKRRPRPSGERGGRIGGTEAARTTVSVLRQAYTWAAGEGILKRDVNPATNIDRHLPRKRRGERVLSLEEARNTWRAAESAGFAFGSLAQLMLLTGCRSDELASARGSWIDLKEQLLVVPASDYKSNHVHVVPLVPRAVEILQSLPAAKTGDFILSSDGGKTPIRGIARFFRSRMPKLLLAMTGELHSNPFTSHALRRTVATRLAEALGDQGDKLVARVLGHSDGSVTAIYNRYGYVKEMRRALERWAEDLTAGIG